MDWTVLSFDIADWAPDSDNVSQTDVYKVLKCVDGSVGLI